MGSEGGSTWQSLVLVVDPARGTTQRSRYTYTTSDGTIFTAESTLEYLADGVHEQEERTSQGTDSWDCRTVPAPLVLPTGAKPGYQVTYNPTCTGTGYYAVGFTKSVTVGISGTNTVWVDGSTVATLVVEASWSYVSGGTTGSGKEETSVLPSNDLVVQMSEEDEEEIAGWSPQSFQSEYSADIDSLRPE